MADDLQGLYDKVLPYLLIDINDLGNEMVKHTSSYAYMAQQLALAKGIAADKKNNLDYKKSVAFIEAKAMTYTDGMGKESAVTDSYAKSCVDVADIVVEAKAESVLAERNLAFWQNVMEAMYQKGFMITKLAEMQQHELVLAGSEYNGSIGKSVTKGLDGVSVDTSAASQAAKRKVQQAMIRKSVE